jgi:hypothetical protein
MKFKLYRTYGALNSPPIFDAFEIGVKTLGHEIVENSEDVAVIWSVLWNGRMMPNKTVYDNCIKQGKAVIIIEVGNFKRETTWRICHQHINGLGIFGNTENLDATRPQKLGIRLDPIKIKRKEAILIASQHSRSLQWEGQPSMEQWIRNTVANIRQFSSRPIVVRPHPRSPIREKIPGVTIELPRKLANSYDDFDIDYNYHCVINYNSGPAVQAAIYGVPVICDSSSLAFPVSEKWQNLENPQLPNRDEWFLQLCHTEWTVDEIAQGIPLARLQNILTANT